MVTYESRYFCRIIYVIAIRKMLFKLSIVVLLFLCLSIFISNQNSCTIAYIIFLSICRLWKWKLSAAWAPVWMEQFIKCFPPSCSFSHVMAEFVTIRKQRFCPNARDSKTTISYAEQCCSCTKPSCWFSSIFLGPATKPLFSLFSRSTDFSPSISWNYGFSWQPW